MFDPPELEVMEREEQEARLRLSEARDRETLDEGVSEEEHHELLHRLEADWKRAHERLQRARGKAEG